MLLTSYFFFLTVLTLPNPLLKASKVTLWIIIYSILPPKKRFRSISYNWVTWTFLLYSLSIKYWVIIVSTYYLKQYLPFKNLLKFRNRFFSSSSVFMYVWACMHACTYVFVSERLHVCIPEDNLDCYLHDNTLTRSLIGLKPTMRPDWLANEHQGSSCLHFLSVEITDISHHDFPWVLTNWVGDSALPTELSCLFVY